jgi:hypothetical protein
MFFNINLIFNSTYNKKFTHLNQKQKSTFGNLKFILKIWLIFFLHNTILVELLKIHILYHQLKSDILVLHTLNCMAINLLFIK